jgi:hypothetical protein
MLESKRVGGSARVEGGKLDIRWHEDPKDGYENDSIAGRARGAAFAVHSGLKSAGVDVWVQGVVVLWADFDQRFMERDKVAWVRGDELTAVLAGRPVKYSGDALEQLTLATRSVIADLRQDRPARSGSSVRLTCAA